MSSAPSNDIERAGTEPTQCGICHATASDGKTCRLCDKYICGSCDVEHPKMQCMYPPAPCVECGKACDIKTHKICVYCEKFVCDAHEMYAHEMKTCEETDNLFSCDVCGGIVYQNGPFDDKTGKGLMGNQCHTCEDHFCTHCYTEVHLKSKRHAYNLDLDVRRAERKRKYHAGPEFAAKKAKLEAARDTLKRAVDTAQDLIDALEVPLAAAHTDLRTVEDEEAPLSEEESEEAEEKRQDEWLEDEACLRSIAYDSGPDESPY